MPNSWKISMCDKQCVRLRSPELELRPLSFGSSLVAQWLGLGTFTAMDPGSIPGQGTNIPQATRDGQKKENGRLKKKQRSPSFKPLLVSQMIL